MNNVTLQHVVEQYLKHSKRADKRGLGSVAAAYAESARRVTALMN